MMPMVLHAVARKAEAATPDAELLGRFIRDRDDPAFEELVRRHGPLVWAVCRQILACDADAEDAFQAVFLTLARSATHIRDSRAVSAWLHGAAVRVATRARRGIARRQVRERRAAVSEVDRPVSDVTWGALIAAVHEEVQRLPNAERTALCCATSRASRRRTRLRGSGGRSAPFPPGCARLASTCWRGSSPAGSRPRRLWESE